MSNVDRLNDEQLEIVSGGREIFVLPFVNITIITGIKDGGKEYVGICGPGKGSCGFGEVH